jgi:hypothetical protein
VCSTCSSRRAGCTWSADPATTPMLAMKQKYEILEARCRDLHGLMQSLIDCPRQQAFRILDNLRETGDVSLTLSLVGGDDSFVNLTNTADFHSAHPVPPLPYMDTCVTYQTRWRCPVEDTTRAEQIPESLIQGGRTHQ